MMHLASVAVSHLTRDRLTSSKWKIRSNSQTFSNARSSDSTNTLIQLRTVTTVQRSHLDQIQNPKLRLRSIDHKAACQLRPDLKGNDYLHKV